MMLEKLKDIIKILDENMYARKEWIRSELVVWFWRRVYDSNNSMTTTTTTVMNLHEFSACHIPVMF